MWAHDVIGRSPSGGLPIGRTLKLTKAPDDRIVADFEFLSEDPFAQRVKKRLGQGLPSGRVNKLDSRRQRAGAGWGVAGLAVGAA